MTLDFNTSLAEGYHSPSQIARVLTEDWVHRNMYCPICRHPKLTKLPNNSPVADFRCNNCGNEFELKSKKRASVSIGKKILGGDYKKMIERIESTNNPHFFFLTYNDKVLNLIFIPNRFFIRDIIEPRKPLPPHAKRAGWVGCNINLELIPEYGKIYIVLDSKELKRNLVREIYNAILELQSEDNIESRKWLVDILQCVDKLGVEFTLNEMYAFTETLQHQHPKNNNVQAKIRQQLQILRKKGVLQFTKRGHYKKVSVK